MGVAINVSPIKTLAEVKNIYFFPFFVSVISRLLLSPMASLVGSHLLWKIKVDQFINYLLKSFFFFLEGYINKE